MTATTTLPAAPATYPAAEVSPAAERLIRDSTAANTRRAYAGALTRLDSWFAGQPLDDSPLVPLHSGFDRLNLSGQRKTGRASGATSTSRLRARPGWRRNSPWRSRPSTIW